MGSIPSELEFRISEVSLFYSVTAEVKKEFLKWPVLRENTLNVFGCDKEFFLGGKMF